MKRLLFSVFSVIIMIINISCEESISPKGNMPVKYNVNLILRGDTTLQTAYIAKLYNVEGFNPNDNKEDPAVTGSLIWLKYLDSNTRYYFRDTVDIQNINTRYNTPSKYYYLKNFRPVFGKEVELNVTLPDGQKLFSKTKIPEGTFFNEEKTLPYIPGPLIGRDTSNMNVVWESSLSLAKAQKVTLPYYYKDLNGVKTKHKVNIPINVTSSTINNNPSDYINTSFKNELLIDRKLFEQILQNISAGDPAKGRYSIASLEIEVFLFDENLTSYYSADLFFDYGFTIRNYPSDITNINGGLGFFASYSYVKRIIKFDPQYLLKKYGYLSEK